MYRRLIFSLALMFTNSLRTGYLPSSNLRFNILSDTQDGCDRDNPTFDMQVLALAFPYAYGHDISHITIHGLWQDRDDGKYPCYCSEKELQNNDISPKLEAKMKQLWPSMPDANTMGDNFKFWKHEYEKHGTCSTFGFPPKQYFETTLALREQYDPMQVFNPGSYSITELQVKAQAVWSASITYGCHVQDGKQYLKEVGLAFSKDLKAIKSPTKQLPKSEINNCDPNQAIIILDQPLKPTQQKMF